jgi:hypothetical protein
MWWRMSPERNAVDLYDVLRQAARAKLVQRLGSIADEAFDSILPQPEAVFAAPAD